jgi:2-methylcitrate dehydratase PrpD
MSDELTRVLARFAAGTVPSDLPPPVVQKSLFAIADGMAVMLGGFSQAGPKVLEVLETLGGRPTASVAGSPSRTSTPLAAWANGILSHVLDYDDVSRSMGGHPTGPVLSAALAAAEEADVDGMRLIAAYAVGVEVMTKLGAAVFEHLYPSGWHPTAVLGTLGACAAAANIWKLDAECTAVALAMAASTAAGIKKNFGTLTKALHVGNAAHNGVLCALLARSGWTADTSALDGPRGLFHLLCGKSTFSEDELARRLANPWEIDRPGVLLKKYPCCGSIHPALDALLAIEGRPEPAKIRGIQCRLHPDKTHVLGEEIPRTGLEAKFSVPYCLAATLLHGHLSLAHFEDAKVARPEIRDLMARIQVTADSAVGLWGAEVVLQDEEGGILRGACSDLTGISDESTLLRKFDDCAVPVLGRAGAQRLKQQLKNLAGGVRVRDLMDAAIP